MTSTQLQCFMAAAEYASFTIAAAKTFVSQSALSKNISRLEEELGIQLFIRDYRSTALTPGGKVLYEGLRDLTSEFRTLVENAREVNHGLTGSLKIGLLSGQLIGEEIRDLIGTYEERYEDIQVSLEYASFGTLLDNLRNRTIDAAFSMTFSVEEEPDLCYREFVMLKNYLVVASSHRLARQEKVAITDLRNETILSVKQSDSRYVTRRLRKTCRDAGFEPVIREAPDLDTLILWTELGRGVSILNEEQRVSSNPGMMRLEIPEFKPTSASIVWSRYNTNPALSLLIGCIPERKTDAVSEPDSSAPR